MGMMHTVIYPTMIYYSVENLVRISNLEDGLTNWLWEWFDSYNDQNVLPYLADNPKFYIYYIFDIIFPIILFAKLGV